MEESSLPTIDEIADGLETFLERLDAVVDRDGDVWADRYNRVWFSIFARGESGAFGMDWEYLQRRLGR